MKKVMLFRGRSVPARSPLIISLMIGLIISLIVLLAASAKAAIPKLPGVWLSQEPKYKLTASHEAELVQDLRRITGLPELAFDAEGRLSLGNLSAAEGDSATARQILLCVLGAGEVFIIEDHCGSPSVTFGQMDEGMHYEDLMAGCRLLVWRVRLDFDDFREMTAPPEVRESFNAGFTMLHELLHGLGYRDASNPEDLGDCEKLINQSRAELGLMLRDQYFADPLRIAPSVFTVRLRFRSPAKAKDGTLNRQNRRRLQYLFFLLPSDYKQ